MFSHPAVIVHGLDDVRAALAPGQRLLLLSAHGAALYAGVGWWMALMRAARAEFPGVAGADILDCADAPGRAMEALRAGQTAIRLDRACPAWPRVAAVARDLGADLLAERPPALDLAAHGAVRRLPVWLETGWRAGDKAAKLG